LRKIWKNNNNIEFAFQFVFGVVAIRKSLGLPLLGPVCGRLSAIFVVLVLICHNEYG
jgi:hypothetical protein